MAYMDEMFAAQSAADEAEWKRQEEMQKQKMARDEAESTKGEREARVKDLTEKIAKWRQEIADYHDAVNSGGKPAMDEKAKDRKQDMLEAFEKELKEIDKEKDKAIKEFNELEEKRRTEEELKKAKTAAAAKDAEFKEMQEKIKVNADKLKKRRKELKGYQEEMKKDDITEEQKQELEGKIETA